MPTKHVIHHGKRIHVRCRRCGRRAYHLRQRTCAACGYGVTPKLRRNSWATKKLNRSARLA